MKRIKDGTPVGMTSPSLYKETEGIVTSSCISYRELDLFMKDHYGKEEFKEDGLAWLETTIRKDDPRHVVEGDYFIIYKDETKLEISMKFKAHGIAYTIRTAKMNCIYRDISVFEKKLDANNLFHGEEDQDKRTEIFHQWMLQLPDASKKKICIQLENTALPV